MSEALCKLGVIGLTTAGQSLAAHHAAEKTRICVCDDDVTFVPQVIKEYKTQMEAGENAVGGAASAGDARASRCMLPSSNMEELVARLEQPRKIIIFGTNGDDNKFQDYWNKLSTLVEKDDMILRWGREEEGNDMNVQFYNNSIVGNLSKMQAKPKGIHLLEMIRLQRDRIVIFQGETPDVFSVGGSIDAYEQLEPYISPCASVVHVGSDASTAHYALMVQRSIENCVMQVFAEGCDMMSKAAGYENQDIGRTFNKWNEEADGKLSCHLSKSSSKIFYKRDTITKKGFVIDHILDSLDLNASDTWVTLEATKLGIPAPTVNAALEARFFSAMKDERVDASSMLKAPVGVDTPSVLKDQIAADLQCAIYCTWICIVAECLSIFQAACDVESWNVNFKECIRLWNLPGSLLESKLMGTIHLALVSDNSQVVKSLLTVPGIATELEDLHMSWRRAVTLSFASAIPCPTLSSSLTHYDSFRSRKLPIVLIKAQRDFFAAEGYERIGMEGHFSTNWIKEHTTEMKKKGAAASGEPKKKRQKKAGDEA